MYFFVKSRGKPRGTWRQFFLPKLYRVVDKRYHNSQQYPVIFSVFTVKGNGHFSIQITFYSPNFIPRMLEYLLYIKMHLTCDQSEQLNVRVWSSLHNLRQGCTQCCAISGRCRTTFATVKTLPVRTRVRQAIIFSNQIPTTLWERYSYPEGSITGIIPEMTLITKLFHPVNSNKSFK